MKLETGRGIITWPIQDDRMNMTKKFEHDQKIYTDDHYPLNLTKNIIYFGQIHLFMFVILMIFLCVTKGEYCKTSDQSY